MRRKAKNIVLIIYSTERQTQRARAGTRGSRREKLRAVQMGGIVTHPASNQHFSVLQRCTGASVAGRCHGAGVTPPVRLRIVNLRAGEIDGDIGRREIIATADQNHAIRQKICHMIPAPLCEVARRSPDSANRIVEFRCCRYDATVVCITTNHQNLSAGGQRGRLPAPTRSHHGSGQRPMIGRRIVNLDLGR